MQLCRTYVTTCSTNRVPLHKNIVVQPSLKLQECMPVFIAASAFICMAENDGGCCTPSIFWTTLKRKRPFQNGQLYTSFLLFLLLFSWEDVSFLMPSFLENVWNQIDLKMLDKDNLLPIIRSGNMDVKNGHCWKKLAETVCKCVGLCESLVCADLRFARLTVQIVPYLMVS